MATFRTMAFIFMSVFVAGLFVSPEVIFAAEDNADIEKTISQKLANEKGCLACHQGLTTIREEGSEMLKQIREIGKSHGDKNGCVVCHGGNPKATSAKSAHTGAPKELTEAEGPRTFYPDPGSIWIAERSCGQCHSDYKYRVERSLMNTEAGKIQGNLHTFGIKETFNQNVPWGNYDVEDTDGQEPSIGSDDYIKYMKAMVAAFPKQFPKKLDQIPLPSVDQIEKDTKLAGFANLFEHFAALLEDSADIEKTISQKLANEKGCLACHQGLTTIREEGSEMLKQIREIGKSHGDKNGCVVCHGGNPKATSAKSAHTGAPKELTEAEGPRTFYPDPGSIWIAERSCGQCHSDYKYRVERSLMNTEAGKIQGNLHTFGIKETFNQNVPWGNYDVEDTDGQEPSIGSDDYIKYMKAMVAAFPKQFPKKLDQIPLPSVDQIEKDTKLAGFTYQRQQCQRCHVGVKGREKRGDYRGMGCSSCHVLYGNEGYYEGKDPTINKEEKGHMLSHRIYGTRKAGKGIPVETCNSCHNRGKRIGVTYQGLMEFPYGSPFNAKGGKQPKLHTKNYLFISDDLHHQIKSRPENPKGGMLCQDCHTTIDMHGDGNIFGTTLAQVEVECQDCHGTTDKYPWELPLGYSEEFGRTLPSCALWQ